MDLIILLFVLFNLIHSAHAQTCSLITPSPSSTCNVCPTSSVLSIGATASPAIQPISIGTTSTGTITIGGGAGSTLSLGPAAAPTVNTINIGGTGSTINIGAIPSPAPSPYPTVTVNGVSPLDWSAWITTTTLAYQTPSTFPTVYSFPWVTNWPSPAPSVTAMTNLNPRATPTRNAYLTPCPAPATPTMPPGLVTTQTYDCIFFPRAGVWKISATLAYHFSLGTAPWTGMYIFPLTATSATASYNLVGFVVGSSAATDEVITGSRVITIPSAAPSPASTWVVGGAWGSGAVAGSQYIGTGTSAPTSFFMCQLMVDYLSPL